MLYSRLQRDFSVITYSIVGDDTAPDFFEVNTESGQVRLAASVADELTELYRVRDFSYSVYYTVIKFM